MGLTDGAEEIVKIASKNVESNLNVKLEDNTLGEGWAKVNGKKSHLGVGRLRWGNEVMIDSGYIHLFPHCFLRSGGHEEMAQLGVRFPRRGTL